MIFRSLVRLRRVRAKRDNYRPWMPFSAEVSEMYHSARARVRLRPPVRLPFPVEPPDMVARRILISDRLRMRLRPGDEEYLALISARRIQNHGRLLDILERLGWWQSR